MGTNGSKSTSPANVVMQLLLELNEAVVRVLSELEATQNSTDNDGTNWQDLQSETTEALPYRFFNDHFLRRGRFGGLVGGKILVLAQEIPEGSGNTFNAQQVISVGTYFNFVLNRLTLLILDLSRLESGGFASTYGFIKLHTEPEAHLSELIIR